MRKHWPIIVVVIFLSPILLCMASCGYLLAYQNIGRITDFRPVTDGFDFPDTNYVLHLSRITFSDSRSEFDDVYNLELESKATSKRFDIGRWTACGHRCLPDFTFIQNQEKTYLIFKSAGYKATHFTIYNLNANPPYQMSTNHPDRREPFRNIYASCSYPRLEDNSLIFEYDSDCELYPFTILYGHKTFYNLELQ